MESTIIMKDIRRLIESEDISSKDICDRSPVTEGIGITPGNNVKFIKGKYKGETGYIASVVTSYIVRLSNKREVEASLGDFFVTD